MLEFPAGPLGGENPPPPTLEAGGDSVELVGGAVGGRVAPDESLLLGGSSAKSNKHTVNAIVGVGILAFLFPSG